MLHKLFEPGDWFAPSRYGYGSALPLVWQGWVFMGAHIGMIVGGALLLERAQAASLLWISLMALAPLPIYAARTRGGWRWRWGEPD